MKSNMRDRTEDEVDWSDGTIDDPPGASTPPSGDSGYIGSPSLPSLPDASTLFVSDYSDSSSPPRKGSGLNHFVEPQDRDEYIVPTGIPISPGTY